MISIISFVMITKICLITYKRALSICEVYRNSFYSISAKVWPYFTVPHCRKPVAMKSHLIISAIKTHFQLETWHDLFALLLGRLFNALVNSE